MLRSVLTRVSTTCLQASRAALFKPNAAAATSMRYSSHGTVETDADFDARYIAYFNNTDNDGWDIRNAMNTLQGYDLVPEPTIIIAGLKACRRLNDYAMAVRFLEAVKDKCGKRVDQIWPYILSEINPTLKELSIETPEELGYDKPELAVVNVNDMHG